MINECRFLKFNLFFSIIYVVCFEIVYGFVLNIVDSGGEIYFLFWCGLKVLF